jgi:1-acyl-sn-glycerol-3-phosphate acyltransferase
MGRENIEKYSIGYAIIKAVFGFWHNNIYYRKVIVLGRNNINPDYHLIFAPNHQNALMDALAVLFTHKGQPIFLARADIFKKKFIASLMYFFKILPVYRIRDGFSSLKENDEIFNKTIDVLKKKSGLVILPEGDHAGFRRLRQLKKGICRIAFQSEQASDYILNIRIIPVGLEFTNYHRFRQVLTVVYGKPIEVSEYNDLYKNSPEKALNELRNRLSSEMMRIMVHIESEEDYEAIDELRSIINGRFSDDIRFPKLFRDRVLIENLNRIKTFNQELYLKICSLSLMVKEKTKNLNLTYRLLEKKKHITGWLIAGLAAILVSFPLYIYGSIFTLTFLTLPRLRASKIKDIQFQGTFMYGISLALALVILPLFLVLSFIIFSPWWLAILVFVTLPFSGLFAWNYAILFRRIMGGFRIRDFIRNKNGDYLNLKKNHDELLNLVATIK